MDELIDVLDTNGKPAGVSLPKSIIHQEGHIHQTSHIWLYNANGDVLLQQRAASKAIHPLLWDVSVAGHIDAGETPEQAAIREAKEEIGVRLLESDLKQIGRFKCFRSYANGLVDNEFHNTFIIKTHARLEDFYLQDTEVEAIKFVSIEAFKTLLESSDTNGHFVSDNKDYYLKVIDAISVAVERS